LPRTPKVVRGNRRFIGESSTESAILAVMPNPPHAARPFTGAQLDQIDIAILDLLWRDARMPNASIAEAVGVAPSTVHARLKQLREGGVIEGFHARVSLSALGRPVQALIAVRLAAHTREQIDSFRAAMPTQPGVVAMFHVSGVNDYLIHVAVADTAALREFVLEHVTSQPGVGHAETSLIFEHVNTEDTLLPR
jgi:DNA-binding Lrp family transcriptional regulator